MIVIDASVAVKWFVEEPFTDEAEALLRVDHVRIAPSHIAAEVGQALLRHVRSGAISRDPAEFALSHMRSFVQIVPADVLASASLSTALRTGTTMFDAIYLACAETEDCKLVTADAKLVRFAPATPMADPIVLLADAIRTLS